MGLDNELKLLPFSLAAGFVLFWLVVLNFIPQVVGFVFFSCSFLGDGVAVYFFKKRFLRSYLGFAGLAFVVAVFGGQNYCTCKQIFLCRQAVTVHFADSF